MTKTIDSPDALRAIVAEETWVVLVFKSPVCPDCDAFEHHLPVLEELFPDMCFLRADRTEVPILAEQFAIRHVPALVVFHEGEVIDRNETEKRPDLVDTRNFLKTAQRKGER